MSPDRTLSVRLRVTLAILWLAALGLLGWMVARQLHPSGDLREFMPKGQTPMQRLVLDELGEGPGSRLLLVAISGKPDADLAELNAVFILILICGGASCKLHKCNEATCCVRSATFAPQASQKFNVCCRRGIPRRAARRKTRNVAHATELSLRRFAQETLSRVVQSLRPC